MFPVIRTFRGYRINPPQHYVEEGLTNGPFDPDYEGIIFSDGGVCVHWLTLEGSYELFKGMEDFEKIHLHPEYGTKIVWGKQVYETEWGEATSSRSTD